MKKKVSLIWDLIKRFILISILIVSLTGMHIIVYAENVNPESSAGTNTAESSEEGDYIGGTSEDITDDQVTFDEIKTMAVGDVRNLNVRIISYDAEPPKVSFISMNPQVLSVDDVGNIYALSEGLTTVKILYSGKIWSTEIRVINPIPDLVDINPGDYNAQMVVGETQQLHPSPIPYNVPDVRFEYRSSDTSVLIINSEGRIETISEGCATIYICAKDVVKEITINVNDLHTNAYIELENYTTQMQVGEKLVLKPTLVPDSSKPAVFSFTSSNKNVAAVSDEGVVTCLSPGRTLITIECEGITKDFNLIVVNSAQSYIDIGKIKTKMNVGDTFQLNPKVITNDSSTPHLVYSSSNQAVATISENGIIKCISKGNTTIRIEAGELSREIELIVEEKEYRTEEEKYIAVGDYSTRMNVGAKQKLNPRVIPESNTDLSFKFRSSAPDVATISNSGEISAISPGIAVISVEAKSLVRSFEIQVVSDNTEDALDYSKYYTDFDQGTSTYSSNSKPSEATVLINTYSYRNNIAAGENFDLKLQLINYSKSKANNIVVRVESKSTNTDLPFFVVGKSNAFYVSALDKGESTELKIPLSSKKTMDSGVYELAFSIKYYDSNGSAYESESVISIVLLQEDGFDFLNVSGIEDCYYGEETYAEITFGNTGKGKLYNIKSVVNAEDCTTDSQMNYYGNLDSGEKGTQGFTFKPTSKEKKKINITIEYTYEDNLGISHSKATQLSFNDLGDRQQLETELDKNDVENIGSNKTNSGDHYKTGFFLLLCAIGGFLCYKLVKNHKGSDNSSSSSEDVDEDDEDEDDDEDDE